MFSNVTTKILTIVAALAVLAPVAFFHLQAASQMVA